MEERRDVKEETMKESSTCYDGIVFVIEILQVM